MAKTEKVNIEATATEELIFSETDPLSSKKSASVPEGKEHVYGWLDLISTILIHGPPLIISIVLTILYFKKPFWFEQTDILIHTRFKTLQISYDFLNLLIQIGAKLYELLVVTSISSIALLIVRNMLASTDGIPLGLITSGFRVGQLGFIFSKPFRASLFGPLFWSYKAAYLGLLFMLSSALVLSIGPSSAILVIPQLGWQGLPNSFQNVVMPLMDWIKKDDLWPLSINSSFTPSNEFCNLCNHTLACPNTGLPIILDWVSNWRTTGLATNLSFQHNDLRRPLKIASTNSGPLGISAATSPTKSVTNTIDNFWRFIRANNHDVGAVYHANRPRFSTSNDHPLLQPFVRTQCLSESLAGLENASAKVFEPSFLQVALQKIQAISNLGHSIDFAWIETNSSSIGAIVGMSYANDTLSDYKQQKWWLICNTSATWEATTLSLDPAISSDIDFELPNINAIGDNSLIKISSGFLDSINYTPDNNSNTTIIETLWEEFLEYGSNETRVYFAPQNSNDFMIASHQVSEIVSKIISIVLTDTLSTIKTGYRPVLIYFKNQTHVSYTDLGTQSGSFDTNKTVPITPDFDPNNELVHVGFDVSRYGYISGTTSPTMIFALFINFIYMVTTFIYLSIFIFILPCLRIKPVKAWDAIEELLMLALVSRQSDKLKNCRAGIKSSESWKQIVSVRTSEDDNVEIVFQESADTNETSMGVHYG